MDAAVAAFGGLRGGGDEGHGFAEAYGFEAAGADAEAGFEVAGDGGGALGGEAAVVVRGADGVGVAFDAETVGEEGLAAEGGAEEVEGAGGIVGEFGGTEFEADVEVDAGRAGGDQAGGDGGGGSGRSFTAMGSCAG